MNLKHVKALHKWAGEFDGVFTLADLKVAFNQDSNATFFRIVDAFVSNGFLFRVKRGLYATPEATLEAISFRICPQAYVSTGTVLARQAIIGSIPVHKVQAVKIGRSRSYACELGTVEHLGIAPHLYFGFLARDGRLEATPEKAFLDVCYFQYKGLRFSFDPHTDVNLDALEQARLQDYLTHYDVRFRSFIRRIMEDGDDRG